eukprot:35166-Rhodomonas_salina.1
MSSVQCPVSSVQYATCDVSYAVYMCGAHAAVVLPGLHPRRGSRQHKRQPAPQGTADSEASTQRQQTTFSVQRVPLMRCCLLDFALLLARSHPTSTLFSTLASSHPTSNQAQGPSSLTQAGCLNSLISWGGWMHVLWEVDAWESGADVGCVMSRWRRRRREATQSQSPRLPRRTERGGSVR